MWGRAEQMAAQRKVNREAAEKAEGKEQAMNEHWRLPAVATAEGLKSKLDEAGQPQEHPQERRPLTPTEVRLGMESLEARVERLEATVEALLAAGPDNAEEHGNLLGRLTRLESLAEDKGLASWELTVESAHHEQKLAALAADVVKMLCKDDPLEQAARAFLLSLFKDATPS